MCCKCPKRIVFRAVVFWVLLFQKGVQFAWAKFTSFLIAVSSFTTGVWEHSETVTVLLCASVLGRQCTVLQSRTLPRFTEEKNHSSILKIKHCMGLQTRVLQPFARKKHCTVLKKQTPCMVLQNGRHPPFARKKTVHSFGKKINLA